MIVIGKRKYSLFIVAILLFATSMLPTIQCAVNPESIITRTTTLYSLTNGSYISGISDMGTSGGGNATFFETLHTITADSVDYNILTDNATEWHSIGAVSAIATDAVTTLSGNAIKATFNANTGDAILHYDNATGDSMNIDISLITSINFSMRADHPLVAVEKIDFHYDSGTYFSVVLNIFLSKTWANFTIYNADLSSYGGMTYDYDINYISFHFSPKNTKNVWIDFVNFIGEKSGETHRELDGQFTFSNFPYRQSYALNISATRSFTNQLYGDSLESESTFGWVSNDTNHLNVYNSTDAVEGNQSIIFSWDGTTNCTMTFDNDTSNDMQLDLSTFNMNAFHIWANHSSFVLGEVRFFTNNSNYFYKINCNNISTSKDDFLIRSFSLMQSYGSPDWANISYISYYFNTYYSTAPVNITIDEFKLGEGDDIDIYIFENGESTVFSIHAHTQFLNETLSLSTFVSDTIRSTGNLTVHFSDLYGVRDTVNNSLYVDILTVTSWNLYAVGSNGGGGNGDGVLPGFQVIPTQLGLILFIAPFIFIGILYCLYKYDKNNW